MTKIDEKSGQPTSVELHLAHFSVKEYLMSERATITQVCLAYLSHIGEHHPCRISVKSVSFSIVFRTVLDEPRKDADTEDVLTNILHIFLRRRGSVYRMGLPLLAGSVVDRYSEPNP
jgi:hypothetical protein